jgi:hypothetical protein
MASSNRRWFQMLFNLDCSVAELEPVNREILDIAIRELLRSHRLGNHVVVISRPICSLLLGIADLTRADRAMLERIAHESTQKANLSKLASHYVNVTPIESDDLKITGRAIHLSFERLGKSKVLERSVLLVENLRRDGLLYSELIRNHFDMHGCTPPSYEPMHGGGNDIGAVFVSQIKGERIVCGIVDSDRSSPIHPDSPKLRALLKISNSMKWPLAFAISPPCREAENCLPMDLLMSLQCGEQNPANQFFLKVSKEERSQGHDRTHSYWLFADLKLGIDADRVAKISDQNEKDWVLQKVRLGALDLNISSVAGYGHKVFDQLAVHGEHLSRLRRLTRHPSWREIFEAFLDHLVWIFAGGHRIAT